MANWHMLVRPMARMDSVSCSIRSLLSAVSTRVSTPKNMRWSRTVRSFKKSLDSFLCSSMS